jgi:hypothetical protein
VAIDYREKAALTAAQQKAFNALKSAFKKCKSSGIELAMQEDTLIALNGRNVLSVEESLPSDEDNEIDLQEFSHEGLDTGICPYIDCSVTVKVKK